MRGDYVAGFDIQWDWGDFPFPIYDSGNEEHLSVKRKIEDFFDFRFWPFKFFVRSYLRRQRYIAPTPTEFLGILLRKYPDELASFGAERHLWADLYCDVLELEESLGEDNQAIGEFLIDVVLQSAKKVSPLVEFPAGFFEKAMQEYRDSNYTLHYTQRNARVLPRKKFFLEIDCYMNQVETWRTVTGLIGDTVVFKKKTFETGPGRHLSLDALYDVKLEGTTLRIHHDNPEIVAFDRDLMAERFNPAREDCVIELTEFLDALQQLRDKGWVADS